MAAGIDKDLQVALCELQVAGLIEFAPDEPEKFYLTDKGIEYGRELFKKLPVKDGVVLMMYKYQEINDCLRGDGDDDHPSDPG